MQVSTSGRSGWTAHRCYSCNKTVSGNKDLCYKHTLEGESALRLIHSPNEVSNSGQLAIYHCTKCEEKSVFYVRDAGLLPLVFQCRATRWCQGGSIFSGLVPRGPGAPKPTHEFYRPRGLDYDRLDPGIRKLVDQGVLDERELREVLVRLAG